VKNSILQIRELADETGRKIGRLEAIAPILKLIRAEGEIGEVYLAMGLVCNGFKAWLKKKNIIQYYTIINSLDILINDLEALPNE
jgi:hypothetical protein